MNESDNDNYIRVKSKNKNNSLIPVYSPLTFYVEVLEASKKFVVSGSWFCANDVVLLLMKKLLGDNDDSIVSFKILILALLHSYL